MTRIPIKYRLEIGASAPCYETEGAAGFDLKAHSFKKLFSGKKEVDLNENLAHSLANGYIKLRPNERVLIGTGIYVQIPQGYQIEIRSRSGMSLNKGLVVLNQPGTIDSDYRGEIMIILFNSNAFLSEIYLGDRVAQGVVMQAPRAEFFEEGELEATLRGTGGFGSTGK